MLSHSYGELSHGFSSKHVNKCVLQFVKLLHTWLLFFVFFFVKLIFLGHM